MRHSEELKVSHGRGGQGNISTDNIPYGDGEIVREGVVGDQGDGAYSAGRGGAANIGSPHTKPSSTSPHDADVIPEMAIREADGEPHHVGRGGAANVDKGTAKSVHPEGLADKLKHKLFPKKS